MNMIAKFFSTWRRHQHWRRAKDEGKHLTKESRRILKRRSYRIPQTVAAEIESAVAEVESAGKGDDFERLREALAALDEGMDKHLAFARKSTAREYSESIGVALAVALPLRAFVVEAIQDAATSRITVVARAPVRIATVGSVRDEKRISSNGLLLCRSAMREA